MSSLSTLTTSNCFGEANIFPITDLIIVYSFVLSFIIIIKIASYIYSRKKIKEMKLINDLTFFNKYENSNFKDSDSLKKDIKYFIFFKTYNDKEKNK